MYDWIARAVPIAQDGLFQRRAILAKAFHRMQKQPAQRTAFWHTTANALICIRRFAAARRVYRAADLPIRANKMRVDPMPEILANMTRSQLFCGADRRVIERCRKLFAVRTFSRGRRLFYQEDSARFVHLVSSGLVRLSCVLSDGHEISLAIVGAGELVGEEALVGEPLRPLIATALETCQTVSASGEELARVFLEEPRLAMNLARYTSLRYSEISMALEDTAQGTVRDRLLRTLKRLALQHGVRSDGGRRIELKLTHCDIATFVASTRETVTLELNALVRIGSISRTRGTITVPDREFDIAARHTSERSKRSAHRRRRGWAANSNPPLRLT